MPEPLDYFLVGLGSHGDVNPVLGLAERLQSQGKRVAFCTSAYFEPMARSYGIPFFPIGDTDQYLKSIHSPDLWHPRKGLQTVARLAIAPAIREVYDHILAQCHPERTVIVAPQLALGARVAQEKHGFHVVTFQLQPVMTRSLESPPRLPAGPDLALMPRWVQSGLWWMIDRVFVDPHVSGELNAFRAELGMPPVRRVMHGWWNSPELLLGLYPDWYAPLPNDAPPQKVLTRFPLADAAAVHPPTDEVRRFVLDGEPPLVFTAGSAMAFGEKFFAASVAAAEKMNRRAVLLARFDKQIPKNLPSTIRHFDYVPLSWLLPRSAALIHHGGIGTLSQGLAAGVPQVIVPFSHDQPDNARRAMRLGVAAEIKPPAYKPRRVAQVLERLLADPKTAASCQDVASRFDGEDSLGIICEHLNTFARRMHAQSTTEAKPFPETV